MQNRMSRLAWVAAVALAEGLLLLPIIGCIGLEDVDMNVDPLPVIILQTNPPDGGEIRVDGRLVILFDSEPGTVTVNDLSATVTEKTAVWTATGLNVGEQVTLTITWESEENDTATITLTVIESTCAPSGDGCVDLLSTEPADGGEFPEDGLLVMNFSGDPGPVTVNGVGADVLNSRASWFPGGLTPGDQAVLDIVWNDGSTSITVTVPELSCGGYLDSCETDDDCCAYYCVLGTCGAPCASIGEVCETDGHCCYDMPCENGTCAPCGGFDEACGTDDDCCDGGPCFEAKCAGSCAQRYYSCDDDADCCSDPCVFGFCGGACAEPGAACEGDGDCCEELPCVNGTCTEGEQCTQTSFPCQSDAECCPLSNGVPVFCVAGSCGGVCQQPRQPCGEAQQCCDEMPCVNGVCTCAGLDEPCETDGDCCNNLPCVDNKCT